MPKAIYKTMLNAKDSMLRLRDEGFSNAEIAQQFGISPPTVVRYIGRQPPGMRKVSRGARELSTQQIEPPPLVSP